MNSVFLESVACATVTVVIRNFNGTAIAVIDDNTWTVFDDDYEYNNDDSTFELVTKGDRDVFFQIFYRNGMIYMSGYLIDENGIGVAMFNNESEINSSQMHMNSMKGRADHKPSPMPSPSEIAIPRIFKYPREKYYSKKL